jgi:High potential iron-sulfur protein
MKHVIDESRRRLLKRVALGVALMPVAAMPLRVAVAADFPLVAADDATAKALKYVDDASKAPDAKAGSKCANCSLYQGAAGSAQGGCLLFPGKAVKASGWCSSWTAKK